MELENRKLKKHLTIDRLTFIIIKVLGKVRQKANYNFVNQTAGYGPLSDLRN